MIPAIVIAVLAVVALAYVVAPVGRERSPLVEDDPEPPAEEKKRVALTGILDLEEERDGGKLSSREFAELRMRYERDAIAALKDLERNGSVGELDARLEREIAAARERLRCATCGAPRTSEAVRCPSCGSPY